MDKSIGERIKERRTKLNITQSQIHEVTGISSGNLSGIESGKSLPSATALINLSKILDCSIDWILTGNASNQNDIVLSNIEKELLNGFRTLPEDEKEELFGILQMKLKKIKRDIDVKLSNSASQKTDHMVV